MVKLVLVVFMALTVPAMAQPKSGTSADVTTEAVGEVDAFADAGSLTPATNVSAVDKATNAAVTTLSSKAQQIIEDLFFNLNALLLLLSVGAFTSGIKYTLRRANLFEKTACVLIFPWVPEVLATIGAFAGAAPEAITSSYLKVMWAVLIGSVSSKVWKVVNVWVEAKILPRIIPIPMIKKVRDEEEDDDEAPPTKVDNSDLNRLPKEAGDGPKKG